MYAISYMFTFQNVITCICITRFIWYISSLELVDSRSEENCFSLGDSTDVPQGGNVTAGAYIFLADAIGAAL